MKEKIDKININSDEEQKIKDKSPDKLPLNPSVLGYSGSQIRKKFSGFIIDDKDSILSVIKEKLCYTKESFLDLEERQDIVESSLEELINNEVLQGVIASDIEAKLNAKEQEYAPRLLNVENNKADIDYVDSKVSAVASGSPKGTYANLAALQLAIPDGNNNIYITLDNGHWNYWNGSAWVSGGVYQATLERIELGFNQATNNINVEFFDFELRGNVSQGISQVDLEIASWNVPKVQNEIIYQDGLPYLVKRVGKVIFNGTETGWDKSSQGYFRLLDLSYLGIDFSWPAGVHLVVRDDIKIEGYTTVLSTEVQNNSTADMTATVLTLPQLIVRNNSLATLNDFKSHLATNPLVLYYEIKEGVETLPLNTEVVYVENPKIIFKDSEGFFDYQVQFNETLKKDDDTYDFIDKDYMFHQRVGVQEPIIRLANASSYTPIIFERNTVIELESDSEALPTLIGFIDKKESLILKSEIDTKATNERVDVIEQRVSDLEDDIEDLNNKVNAIYDGGVPVALPQYALDELELTRSKLSGLFKTNTFNFTFISDVHGNGIFQDKTQRELEMIRVLDSEYHFDCHIHGGDWLTNDPDVEVVKNYLKWKNNIMLKTKASWLLTPGNHDDNYLNIDGKITATVLTDFWSEIYRPHSDKYNNFDLTTKNPMHYFVDYPKQKIRVVVMNAYDSASNVTSGVWGYQDRQITWLHKVALDFSGKNDREEWAVLMVSHMGDRVDISSYYTTGGIRNGDIVNSILKAFNTGTTFNLTNEYVSINGDFTSQGAMEIIMWVYGHSHYDILYKPEDCNWWYFNTASSHPSVRSENPNMIVPYDIPSPRTIGTANEFLFNVISIDRFNRKVKIVRVGAGNDYEFEY